MSAPLVAGILLTVGAAAALPVWHALEVDVPAVPAGSSTVTAVHHAHPRTVTARSVLERNAESFLRDLLRLARRASASSDIAEAEKYGRFGTAATSPLPAGLALQQHFGLQIVKLPPAVAERAPPAAAQPSIAPMPVPVAVPMTVSAPAPAPAQITVPVAMPVPVPAPVALPVLAPAPVRVAPSVVVPLQTGADGDAAPSPLPRLDRPAGNATVFSAMGEPMQQASLPPASRVTPVNPVIGRNDSTAVYDISAATVYLPDGERLEAHSGLGYMVDNPRYADRKNIGPTPPNTYNLVRMEGRFHGVEALRLVPVDGYNKYGRDGLLTHTYLLRGRPAQSNGCVVFKDYDRFLEAFKRGSFKRLVVVASLSNPTMSLASASGGKQASSTD